MFASSKVPPVELTNRRKLRSKLMLEHVAAASKVPAVPRSVPRAVVQANAPAPASTPALRRSVSFLGLDETNTVPSRSDSVQGPNRFTHVKQAAARSPKPEYASPRPGEDSGAGATGGSSMRDASDADDHTHPAMPSPPPSPPNIVDGGSFAKRAEAKAQMFKTLLMEASRKERMEREKSIKALRWAVKPLLIAGLLNVYTPQGILAVATAILVQAVRVIDVKPERNVVSLAQLQGKKLGLLRVKKKLALSRVFCAIADVLGIFTLGFTGISGVVGAVLPGSAIPQFVSMALLGVAVASLILVISSTYMYVLVDSHLYLIELKLADIKLAEDRVLKDEDGDAASRDSRSSKSSRMSTQLRASKRLYWTSLQSKCVDACFSLLFLFYPSCSSTIFQTFDCSPFDDGTRFLRGDWSINCDSFVHKLMEQYAIMMIFVWPIGVPIIYAMSIYLRSGIFSRLKLIEAEIRQQRLETSMRELFAKEEETFSNDFEKEVRVADS